MGYTFGELKELTPEAMTIAIRQPAFDQAFYAMNNIFTGRKKVLGTDHFRVKMFRGNRRAGKWGVQDAPSYEQPGTTRRILEGTLGHISLKQTIEESVLLYLQSGEDNKIDQARQWVLDAQMDLRMAWEIALEEAMWQALGGQISINYGTDPENRIILSMTFGFRSTHQAANTAVSWATAAHKILTNTTDGWYVVKGILHTDTGLQTKEVVMNAQTLSYLYGNTEVTAFMGDRTKELVLEDGRIARIQGVNITEYDMQYEAAASGSATKFVANDMTYWLPDRAVRADHFMLLEGQCLRPNASVATGGNLGFDLVEGMASWLEIQQDPAAAIVHLKWNGLPILDPDAVVRRDVTP